MITQVKLITDQEEIEAIYSYIKKFPLDYPNYFDWLEKCKEELEAGYKKGFYARNSEQKIIGSIIFQPHKQEKQILEIKSMRVSPEYQRRRVGSILYNLVEEYAYENRFGKIQVDAHADNSSIIQFFATKGFNIEAQESLYSPSKMEVILSKTLK